MVKHFSFLLLALLTSSSISCAYGRELPQTPDLARRRTTTHAEDEALAYAAAAAAVLVNPSDTTLGSTVPVTAAPLGTAATATAADATAAVAATVVAAVAACVSPQFEWPAGSGYCWFKRDSGGQAGPGNNVFKPANVAVNSNDQLVLTILNPSTKQSRSSCGEVFLNQTYGYGDYTFVVATNPVNINQRLVGAPFIYDTDTKEYDFEFSTWNTPGSLNSQFVVQPYTTNAPVRYNINAADTTHRMRWTPESVVFESFYPDSMGGGLIKTYTYAGPNDFAPGTERVHINYWIYKYATQVPASSQYVTNCFRFCANTNLATCSTPLGTKPRCSATRTW